MIRMMAKLVCILAGLCCLLALADRRGWTDPLWATCWPQVVLPRRPSHTEEQVANLESRLETIKQETSDARDSLAVIAGKRRKLLKELRDCLGDGTDPDDMARLPSDDPVAFALLRSIDAEDRKQAEGRRELANLERERARLEARRIAASNGVSLIDPVAPSEQLRAEAGEESAADRYRRILREARDTN